MYIRIGIDIGGTNTVLGAFGQEHELISKRSIPTGIGVSEGATNNPHHYLDRVVETINHMLEEIGSKKLLVVGAGVPGRVDAEHGIAISASNLRWRDVPFAQLLSVRLNAPVYIDNDVRMYTLGESVAGAGRGYRNLACITLGTGIAMGVIVDGVLLRGGANQAGEIGHDYVEGNQALCSCGKLGCLETIASASGITRLTRDAIATGVESPLAMLDNISSLDVFQASLEGDRLAQSVFEQVGIVLARKLATISLLLDPDAIIVGGGVAAAGDILLNPIRDYLNTHGLLRGRKPLVLQGTLGDSAGLIGAMQYATSRRE